METENYTLALESVEELRTAATVQAANDLRDIAESVPSKAVRKAARRALYLLSQKHVLPDERDGVLHEPRSRPGTEVSIAGASVIDGLGNQCLFFLVPTPDGGLPRLYIVVTEGETGIAVVIVSKVARSTDDTRVRAMVSNLFPEALSVTLGKDYTRFLLQQAIEKHLLTSDPIPPHVRELVAILGPVNWPSGEQAIYTHYSPGAIHLDPTINRDASDLFERKWFQTWFLDLKDVASCLADWHAAQPKLIATVGGTVKERQERSVSNASRGLMTGPRAATYARRLEIMAEVHRVNGDTDTAKAALFHALELRGDHPERSDFARTLVLRTLLAASEAVEQEEREGPVTAGHVEIARA